MTGAAIYFPSHALEKGLNESLLSFLTFKFGSVLLSLTFSHFCPSPVQPDGIVLLLPCCLVSILLTSANDDPIRFFVSLMYHHVLQSGPSVISYHHVLPPCTTTMSFHHVQPCTPCPSIWPFHHVLPPCTTTMSFHHVLLS